MGIDIYERVKFLAEDYSAITAWNLSQLVRIKSLSCNERALQKELKRQMEINGADEVMIDGLGNVIGRLGKGPRTIAIDGHVDTVDTGNMEEAVLIKKAV
jgi:acetylornithine deacetylase/succinyl-diaminopimelate desuccinylase-like protein